MNHDVFVSYSSPNREVAEAACAALEGRGMKCWIAPRDVTAGESWSGEIVEAIARAKLMVLVFSSQANASKHVLREVERAVHHGIPIIPLRIEKVRPTKELEYFLSVKHWLEADTRPLDQHLERLVTIAAATVKAASPPLGPDPTARPQSPLDRSTRGNSNRPVPTFGPPESPAPPKRFVTRRSLLWSLGLLPLLGGGWWWSRARRGMPPAAIENTQPTIARSARSTEVSPQETRVSDNVADPANGHSKPIDLLALIDDVRDAPYGWIVRRGKRLIIARGPAQKTGVALVIPWRPPAAYRLHLRIGRTPDTDAPIALGLASAGHLFTLVIDHGPDGLRQTGLVRPNRELLDAVSTGGLLIGKQGLVDLVVTVEPGGVDLQVGNKASDEGGDLSRDQLRPLFAHRGDVRSLYDGLEARRGAELIIASSFGIVLEKLSLEPLAGDPGRALRTPDSPNPGLP
ncbi:MAG: toll/interleukin-1 receptor domain-containing protein [Planctomycetaceae bacterium]